MLTRKTFLLASAGCLLFLLGCKEPKAQAQRPAKVEELVSTVVCPDFSTIKARRLVLFLIDRSGSVQDDAQNRLDRIQEDGVQLVRRLPPATLVFVHFISEQSYRDTERYLIDAIPEEPPPFECHADIFDYRKKRQCRMEKLRHQAQLRCVVEARQRIIAALEGLAPPRANYTDVWGAMAVADEVFRAHPTSHRLLLVYSDIDDNVRTPLRSPLLGFKGAEVIVRAARTDGPDKVAQRLAAFDTRLSGWGAKVSSWPIDIPLNGIFGHETNHRER